MCVLGNRPAQLSAFPHLFSLKTSLSSLPALPALAIAVGQECGWRGCRNAVSQQGGVFDH